MGTRDLLWVLMPLRMWAKPGSLWQFFSQPALWADTCVEQDLIHELLARRPHTFSRRPSDPNLCPGFRQSMIDRLGKATWMGFIRLPASSLRLPRYAFSVARNESTVLYRRPAWASHPRLMLAPSPMIYLSQPVEMAASRQR